MTSTESNFEIVKGPNLLSVVLALIMQLPITFTIKVKTGATEPSSHVLQEIYVTSLISISLESGQKDESGYRFNWMLTGFFRFPSETFEQQATDDKFRAYYNSRERHGNFTIL